MWKWNFYDFVVFRLSLAPMSIREYISLYKKTLIKVGKEQRKERVLRKLETFSRADDGRVKIKKNTIEPLRFIYLYVCFLTK